MISAVYFNQRLAVCTIKAGQNILSHVFVHFCKILMQNDKKLGKHKFKHLVMKIAIDDVGERTMT